MHALNDDLRVEQVISSRIQRNDLIRVWHDGAHGPALVAATCRVDGVLHHVEDLLRDGSKPGGRRLLCREHQAEATRRRVESGRNAESKRNQAKDPAYLERRRQQDSGYRSRNPEKFREDRRRVRRGYAERTLQQVAADRAHLRPEGLQVCRTCQRGRPYEAFFADATKPSGLSDSCRSCHDRHGLWSAAADAIEERDTWLCAYCGEAPIEHIDHVHPRALGGTDSPENLVGACATCNTSKGAKPLFEWRPDLSELVTDWEVEVRLTR